MALNIAVPLYGILDGFGFLSPHYDNNSKLSASPIESESSGISSLDSDDVKKQLSSPSPIENDDELLLKNDEKEAEESDKEVEEEKDEIDPEKNDNVVEDETMLVEDVEKEKEVKDDEEEEKKVEQPEVANETADLTLVETVAEEKTAQVETGDKTVVDFEATLVAQPTFEPNPPMEKQDVKIFYQNRDVLDLGANITDSRFQFRYAVLPTNNLNMFFANRSQYHRLGANGERQEFSYENCKSCDFYYPMIIFNNNQNNNNSNNANKSSMMIPNNNNLNNNQKLNNTNLEYIKNPLTTSLKMFLKNIQSAEWNGMEVGGASGGGMGPIGGANNNVITPMGPPMIPITKKNNNLNINLNNINKMQAVTNNSNNNNSMYFGNNGNLNGNGNAINYFDNQKSTKINNFNYNGTNVHPNGFNNFQPAPPATSNVAMTLLNMINRNNANASMNTSNIASAAAAGVRLVPPPTSYSQNINIGGFNNGLYKQF